MLKSLTIENYALIDAQEIRLEKGFLTITGETGAGKSILLGALSLLTGQRADVNVLRNKEKRCIVEASFDLKKYKLASFFEENDLDYEDITTIRRMINPNGKSRAFVNDVPVTVQQLKLLSPKLIDIHSQHQNLLLQDQGFQMMVVDTFAENTTLLDSYSIAFLSYKKAQSALKALEKRAAQSIEEIDYIKHQYEELESANLLAEEPSELEQELEILTHTEDIKNGLLTTSSLLNGEEVSVLSQISDVVNALRSIENFYPKAAEFCERADSAYYDLKDIAEETESLAGNIEHDSAQIDYINQRLAQYFQLQRKHRVASVEELIEIRDKYETQLNEIENFDTEIERLTALKAKEEAKITKIATNISQRRAKQIPKIEKNIKSQLETLGMPNSKLKIEQTPAATFQSNGMDQLAYLFTANKKGELQAIDKVASGGEISRVMLTLKALLSENLALPTIVFDEIDTGVSGDIADKMGEIMRSMAINMQVISITHLPQVASKGDHHYRVFKHDTQDSTFSNIQKLTDSERRDELAKMLSGSELTEAALNNADELLRTGARQARLFQ